MDCCWSRHQDPPCRPAVRVLDPRFWWPVGQDWQSGGGGPCAASLHQQWQGFSHGCLQEACWDIDLQGLDWRYQRCDHTTAQLRKFLTSWWEKLDFTLASSTNRLVVTWKGRIGTPDIICYLQAKIFMSLRYSFRTILYVFHWFILSLIKSFEGVYGSVKNKPCFLLLYCSVLLPVPKIKSLGVYRSVKQ
jgi:hypothetical protein